MSGVARYQPSVWRSLSVFIETKNPLLAEQVAELRSFDCTSSTDILAPRKTSSAEVSRILRASHQGGRLTTSRSESFHLMETSSRTGDYWSIPARVASGSVEWAQTDELNPRPLPPCGIEHHYALLGFGGRGQNGRSTGPDTNFRRL